MSTHKNKLWLRWSAANALSEVFGLGATFAAIALLLPKIERQQTAGILLAFAVSVVCGAIEATVVGLAQWWAMRPWFPQIRRSDWWRATLIGALLGYAIGYLPSALLHIRATTQTPIAEPPQWVTLLLAAGLGIVAGAVLSFAQWWVLRNKVRSARLWVPANMLAWAVGMPVIFWGMDLAFSMTTTSQRVCIIGGTLLVTGAIVGVIHGRFLMVLSQVK
ncbi:hypothetical protein H6F89_13790 [Cyanobacteria bacterium FACHB-63]|nr:hypothetical protein [Cyanobacteria bacterium FACHB-63]